MEIDRSFLSRTSDVYRHQILGFTYETSLNNSAQEQGSENYFPKLRAALECGRSEQLREDEKKNLLRNGRQTRLGRGKKSSADSSNGGFTTTSNIEDIEDCIDWRIRAAQEIIALTRSLDAASAVLQSPLLPEESE